jgi:hypothetical protein
MVVTRSKTLSLVEASSCWSTAQRGLLAVHYAHRIRLARRYLREASLLKYAHRHGVVSSMETLEDSVPTRPTGCLSFMVVPLDLIPVYSKPLCIPETDAQFMYHLQSLRVDSDLIVSLPATNFDSHSIESMGYHLRSLSVCISRQVCHQLTYSFQLGRDLNLSKLAYNTLKVQGSLPWQKWVASECKISKTHANRLIALSGLAHDYPGFRCLTITSTALHSKIQRIRSILASNPALADTWIN